MEKKYIIAPHRAIVLLLVSAVLSACGVAMTEGEKWLDSQKDAPEMNIAGMWDSPEWGKANFKQEKREISGMLGDYPVRGVVSGNNLYLLMYAGDKVHYSAKLKASDENTFQGSYSKYSIIDQPRSGSDYIRPINLRRVSKDVSPGSTDAVRSQAPQEGKSTQERVAAIPAETKPVVIERIKLRDRAEKNFSDQDLQKMIKERNFFNRQFNPGGNFPNDFVDNGDGTVTDKVTWLMWQKGGSSSEMIFDAAAKYTQELNSSRYGSYGDWRLPTMEELCSLLEGTPNKNGKFIDNLFDFRQEVCWSADENQQYISMRSKGAFSVNFGRGETSAGAADRFMHTGGGSTTLSRFYVRAVRTAE